MVVSACAMLKSSESLVRFAWPGERCEHNNVMDNLKYRSNHVSILSQFAWQAEAARAQQCGGVIWCSATTCSILEINLVGWGKRCERNDVMVHVGVLLELFESFVSTCLAGGC